MFSEKAKSMFLKYLFAREEVRERKESCKPWPWTEDPVLQKYKFTNVRRTDDRTTRELVKLYDENRGAPPAVVLYNCGLFRYFGTYEFAQAVGFLQKHDPKKIMALAKQRIGRGERVYTGAYMITNAGRAGPKEVVVTHFLKGLWDAAPEIVAAIRNHQSWQTGYDLLTGVDGFGGSGFMAKEVLQDYLLTCRDIVSDRDNWTPVGPGARRGLNRLLMRPLNHRQNVRKYISEVVELRAQIQPGWLARYRAEPLSAHDIQFNLCEFDKYSRCSSGEGSTRSLYRRAA